MQQFYVAQAWRTAMLHAARACELLNQVPHLGQFCKLHAFLHTACLIS